VSRAKGNIAQASGRDAAACVMRERGASQRRVVLSNPLLFGLPHMREKHDLLFGADLWREALIEVHSQGAAVVVTVATDAILKHERKSMIALTHRAMIQFRSQSPACSASSDVLYSTLPTRKRIGEWTTKFPRGVGYFRQRLSVRTASGFSRLPSPRSENS